MKLVLSFVALLVAATTLTAGQFDSERPSWAPEEPNFEASDMLRSKLLQWAYRNDIVSQYHRDGLATTFGYGSPKGNGRLPLAPHAPNTLTDEQQAEVDELNRLVVIETLEQDKHALEYPRRAPAPTPLSPKQVQLDTIDELREEIALLREELQDNKQVVVEEETFSTPAVVAMAGFGGAGLASLFGLAFMRRGVVS